MAAKTDLEESDAVPEAADPIGDLRMEIGTAIRALSIAKTDERDPRRASIGVRDQIAALVENGGV